jgi:hypothetical protein
MNDTAILELVKRSLRQGEWSDKRYGGSFNPSDKRNDGQRLLELIEHEQSEEELNERIKKEVKRQLSYKHR